jgi:PAS domain S-box-containing protein
VQNHYLTIVKTMSEGAMLLDADGTIVACNASAERILGVRAEDIVGVTRRDPIWRAIHEDGSPFPNEDLPVAVSLRERKTVTNVPIGLYQPAGSLRWIRVSATPLFRKNEEAPYRVTVTISDMTEARALQAQLAQAQKLEALGQLAGGIAHDFNNMLMVIFSRVEMLKLALPTEDRLYRYVNDIGLAAEQNARLTQQLLASARRQVLQPEVISISEVVSGLMQLLSKTLGEQVTIHTTLPKEAWRTFTDPGQVGQVLLNLAVNARDAMPDGGTMTVEIQNFIADAAYIALRPQIPHGEYVVLVVSDTGVGMPPDVRERIFDPFFTTKDPGKGTGLGLAVVHGIMEQMGGHVTVYSELGHGTTFKLFFPRYYGDVQRRIVVEENAPERGTETILVVEDEELVRKVLVETLEAAGYIALSASDPVEAIALAGAHGSEIDLLLSDVILPIMKGPDLADQLRSAHPNLRIILMSGYSDGAIANHASIGSAARFLEKPVQSTTLLNTVRAALDEE